MLNVLICTKKKKIRGKFRMCCDVDLAPLNEQKLLQKTFFFSYLYMEEIVRVVGLYYAFLNLASVRVS